jgi:hypothetical protein
MTKREETNAVGIFMKMNVKGKRGRGRPKKRWLGMIENDMRAIGMYVEDIVNRDEWEFRTKVPDPNSWGKGEGTEETLFFKILF